MFRACPSLFDLQKANTRVRPYDVYIYSFCLGDRKGHPYDIFRSCRRSGCSGLRYRSGASHSPAASLTLLFHILLYFERTFIFLKIFFTVTYIIIFAIHFFIGLCLNTHIRFLTFGHTS